MKKILQSTISSAVLLGMIATVPQPAFADDDHHGDHHQDHRDVQRAHEHRHWHRGGQIEHQDWDRGTRIDYREHHLREPPPGYEWRQVGPNFILAAVATGIIASIIAAGH